MSKSLVKKSTKNMRWQLVLYDALVFLTTYLIVAFVFHEKNVHGPAESMFLGALFLFLIIVSRSLFGIYHMILRYGGVQCYLRLFVADFAAMWVFYVACKFLPVHHVLTRLLVLVTALNLLGGLFIRIMYRYCFGAATRVGTKGKLARWLLELFGGPQVTAEKDHYVRKISIAIVGAGRLGSALANELLSNESASYMPVCFVDADASKQGRSILGVPVVTNGDAGIIAMKNFGVQEVVFAITELENERRMLLYKFYRNAGFKVKAYDYPMHDVNKSGRPTLREYSIEELLFRPPVLVNNALTRAHYRGKVVLITGGGGSIGSELCRQLAKMEPKQVIILDVYENGAYDVQQELILRHGAELNLKVEICSVCNKEATARVFAAYHPDIVIHAAAHKHVPLMEHNVIEAVENNVFGTLNVIELCEEFGVQRFMMVSTDKAVNPTNVMGATKRMCEIIAKAHSDAGTGTTFSATRFGNVLGSAGSVIPLFKRQIAHGGPITLTDKRIIRYFMTIPEASQLVLESGAMAKNGELFVLDMGKPVKILDLAENMIRLSGLEPDKDIEIREIGLRPGEKLYEELLVKSETLTTTDNKLIFVERDEGISLPELEQRLQLLREACASGSEAAVRQAMHVCVPTYKSPEEVNARAVQSEEMQNTLVIKR